MERKTIHLTLTTTMSADEWEITPPVGVAVQVLITKFVREPEFGLKEFEDDGTPIPYRLLWREGNRYMRETETLASAGVQENHTLMMSFEARAGNSHQRERAAYEVFGLD